MHAGAGTRGRSGRGSGRGTRRWRWRSGSGWRGGGSIGRRGSGSTRRARLQAEDQRSVVIDGNVLRGGAGGCDALTAVIVRGVPVEFVIAGNRYVQAKLQIARGPDRIRGPVEFDVVGA